VSQQAVPCLAYLTRTREDMNWLAIRSVEDSKRGSEQNRLDLTAELSKRTGMQGVFGIRSGTQNKLNTV